MKKAAWIVFVLSLLIFIIAWGVMGIKIFTHDYDITALAYIGGACIPLIFGSLLIIKLIGAKCPHCGKFRAASGDFCPHCGKKLNT